MDDTQPGARSINEQTDSLTDKTIRHTDRQTDGVPASTTA